MGTGLRMGRLSVRAPCSADKTGRFSGSMGWCQNTFKKVTEPKSSYRATPVRDKAVKKTSITITVATQWKTYYEENRIPSSVLELKSQRLVYVKQ